MIRRAPIAFFFFAACACMVPGVGQSAVGQTICNAPGYQIRARVATDGVGGAFVCWQDCRAQGCDPSLPNTWLFHIYAHHILASGAVDPSWTTNGMRISGLTGDETDLDMIPDGSGGALVAWVADNPLASIYVQHVLSTGAVDPAWTAANGNANGTLVAQHMDSGPVDTPMLATDGAGGAIVVWFDHLNVNNAFVNRVFAQHVLASGVLDWRTALCNDCGPFPEDPYADSPGLQVIPDAAGGAIAAWQGGGGTLANSDIYAQRVLMDGTVGWPFPDGLAVSVASGQQRTPRVLAMGGDALIVWEDLGQHRIYGQLVSAAGVPAYAPNGIALCNASSVQELPAVTTGASGRFFVTWVDHRNAGNVGDIYAQSFVTGSGAEAPGWPANGIDVCATSEDQTRPKITTDGAGGAIVTWQDQRTWPPPDFNHGYDIFSHHVLSTGSMDPSWPSDATRPGKGNPICDTDGDQTYPQIVSDGSGGGIIVWVGQSIYGQKEASNGQLVGPVAAVPPKGVSSSVVYAPYPNPSPGAMAVEFDLESAQVVSVAVLDLTGHRIRALISAQEFPAGSHKLVWDGKNDLGVRARSGIYLLNIATPRGHVARKAILLR